MKNVTNTQMQEFITCEIPMGNGIWIVESIACVDGVIARTLATCIE